MPGVMMLSREVKRVPLDFDAPIGKTWQPRLESPTLPPCPVCGPAHAAAHGEKWDGKSHGDGYSPEYRQLHLTWYGSLLVGWTELDRARGEAIRWDNKIGQPEADALVEHGRFNPVIDCPRGCKKPEERGWVRGSGESWKTDCPECQGRGWTRKKLKAGDLSAAEINEWQNGNGFGVNCWIVLKARCELLGFPVECSGCTGDGAAGTAEERKAAEEWEMPEPPKGPGYQLWQSVSEGGPVSPVCETPEALADWLSEHCELVGHVHSAAEWRKIIDGDVMGSEIGTGELV